MEDQALYLSALQEEIAQTLESVEGVVSARVHVQQKSSGRPGHRSPVESTASVLISYRPDPQGSLPLPEQAVQKVVAHAVAGLSPARVAVVFAPRRKVVLPAGETDSAKTPGGVKTAAVGVASAALGLSLVVVIRRWRRGRPRGGHPGRRG
jgi:type III secretion protein J